MAHIESDCGVSLVHYSLCSVPTINPKSLFWNCFKTQLKPVLQSLVSRVPKKKP